MNRIKAIYRGRAIPCEGQRVYHRQKRAEWLNKLIEPGARKRAEILYSELDHLKKLHKKSKAVLIQEARKHKAVRLLVKTPGLGPIRSAQIMAIVGYPHRFSNRRRFWTYCGLAVVMRSSADYQIVDGMIKKRINRSATRGLNRNHNRELKEIFRGAALTAIQREPFKSFHQQLLDRKLSPEVARVAVARKLSAIVLHLWKKGEAFDPEQLTRQKNRVA
jgi:transposase